MIQKSIAFISNSLTRLESRFGLFPSSLILGSVFFIAAMMYVQPVFHVTFHGIGFSRLSENPFDFSRQEPLRYRILTPFAGYLLFLRGPNFFILPLLVAWLFPGVVYFQYRKKNAEAIDAFFLSCFIAFSCVVLLPLVAPGYTDVVTWLFIFLAFARIGNILLSVIFFSLALLNHESSFVLLPAIILYCYQQNKISFIRILFFYTLACIPHLCYRYFVLTHSDTLYGLSFYFSKGNILFSMKNLFKYLPASVFYTFKLWWIFPLCCLAWAFLSKKYLQCLILILIIAGAFSLLIISYDYTRMLVIAFPAVLLSYQWMMKSFNAEKFRKFSFVLIVLNFFILQYQFNYDGGQPMFPWVLNNLSAIFGTPLI